MRIVTWSTTRGDRINVCKRCEKSRKDNWPKNQYGEEYATVYFGLHDGVCDTCKAV